MIKRTPIPRRRITRPISTNRKLAQKWVAQDNTATIELSGGIANIFFKMFFVISYALKHGIKYYFSDDIRNPHSNVRQWDIPCTGVAQERTTQVNELKDDRGFPYVQELPLYQNPVFNGYWQSYEYLSPFREQLAEIFKFPKKFNKGIVSIHVRRGDATLQVNEFPMLLKQYYDDAIAYMNNEGHFKFKVYSDDIPFAETWFTKENYPKCKFIWQDTDTDYETIMDLAQCEHHIVARSTFSFMAAWICPNKDKIVCCPPFPLFKHCHRDIIPPDWIVIDTEINTKTRQNWAQYKKLPVSFAKLPNRKKLDNVTLISLSTLEVEQAAKALMYSCKGIDFAAVKLISPYRPSFLPKYIEWEYIEKLQNINAWNHYLVYHLWKHVDTEFVFISHPDGMIVEPDSWRDSFLDYDYIGSPWPTNKVMVDKNGEPVRVGNSVGIRSKKLLELPSKIGMIWRTFDGNYNEDTNLTICNRELLIEHGIKFAPLSEAIYFGRESEIPENQHIDKPFCIHKWKGRNIKYPQF